MVWATIDIDKPDRSLLRDFDVIGLVLMATFLGCLEYALEEGPRWDWLDDSYDPQRRRSCPAVAGVFFFWRVLTYRQPIVDLRAYGNRNFTLGSFYTFLIGIGMYGTTYLVPLFLAQVRGYSSLQIGTTVVVAGLFMMVLSPFSPQIARRLDLRLMLGIGLVAVRGLDVSDRDEPVEPGRVPGAVRAAGAARHRADVLLSAGQYAGARHGAARQAQERRRPLQFDPRSRRRARARRRSARS